MTQASCVVQNGIPNQCVQVFTVDVKSQVLTNVNVTDITLYFRDSNVPSMCEAINVYVPIHLAPLRSVSKRDVFSSHGPVREGKFGSAVSSSSHHHPVLAQA